MDLILWRHAEAVEGKADLERELTAKGRQQAQRVAEWLQQRLPAQYALISSPAARAQQTARALAARFKVAGPIAPGGSVAQLLDAAQWPDHKGTVILVGHQPTLGQAAAFLVCGSQSDSWSVKKGGLWWLGHRIRDEESAVVVRAVVSPDLL